MQSGDSAALWCVPRPASAMFSCDGAAAGVEGEGQSPRGGRLMFLWPKQEVG